MVSFLLVIGISFSSVAAPKKHSLNDEMLKIQVLLDRHNFSPGEIDGQMGANTNSALIAFQQANGLNSTGSVDQKTLQALESDQAEILTDYTISLKDTAGPFEKEIPSDYMEQSHLKDLAYTSISEELGEKFHCDPKLLGRLNRGSTFEAGEIIKVPNVLNSPQTQSAPKNEEKRQRKLIVDEQSSTLRLLDADGQLLFFAPVTAGSKMDPLPPGTWKVTGISKNPKFQYSPELFWDADPTHTKATLPPGPNNPVGVVWIDIDAPHYGLHGTPEPGRIGYSESHGCVRLTNWDALRLAEMIAYGTEVVFENGSDTSESGR